MTQRQADVRIRPAVRADLPAIVAMRDDLNRLELEGCPHASIQHLSVEEFTEIWGASLDDPDHCWRIVEQEGRPIGYGLIYLSKPRTRPPGAFIHWAYLEPGQRRRGVGQMLLDQMIDWARKKGANRVELQFIDGNTVAQRFWEKIGFRPFARKCVRYLG